MKKYGKDFNPASNAKGVDTSPHNNPAPKGIRVKSKKRLRKNEKSSRRFEIKNTLLKELQQVTN